MRHIGALQRGLGFALVGDGTLWALAVNGVWWAGRMCWKSEQVITSYGFKELGGEANIDVQGRAQFIVQACP